MQKIIINNAIIPTAGRVKALQECSGLAHKPHAQFEPEIFIIPFGTSQHRTAQIPEKITHRVENFSRIAKNAAMKK